MNTRLRTLALAVALAVMACGGGGSSDHPGRGVVVSVDAAKGEITLDHEDIPGLMMGMTMTFHADPTLLAGVEPGQQVDFRVREEGGRYVVTAIERPK
ncbi:MAG: copper-binding protein [Myxococcota bacterium]